MNNTDGRNGYITVANLRGEHKGHVPPPVRVTKGRAVDAVNGLGSVNLVKRALQYVRDNINDFHVK